MAAISRNQLLLGTIIVLAFYWVAGAFTPDPYLSSAVSLLLLIVGVITMARYSPDTWAIVIKGKRSPDERGHGSHLAIYGIWLLAAGSCYSGAYGLTWVSAGQPLDWIGTTFSNFGRFLLMSGFALVCASPNVTKEGIKLPGNTWVYVLLAMMAAACFWAGTQFRNPVYRETWISPALFNRPRCGDERPIWGTSRHIYHTPLSPYRDLVVPKYCFRSEAEARGAGFSPPKWDASN